MRQNLLRNMRMRNAGASTIDRFQVYSAVLLRWLFGGEGVQSCGAPDAVGVGTMVPVKRALNWTLLVWPRVDGRLEASDAASGGRK